MVEKTSGLSEGDGGLEEDFAGEVFIPEDRRPKIDLAKYTRFAGSCTGRSSAKRPC